jgi:hypothetical protein
MKLDDEFIFFISEITTLEVRAEIVYPPQSATLAASKQSYRNTQKNSAKLIKKQKIMRRVIFFFSNFQRS